MTYANGTINDANPGPTLYAAMEPHFLAAGFTLADTVTIGARTHKVLKSDAADNTYGLTWYLDVHYPTTGAGVLMMAPFEDFNATTDLGFRGPHSANSTIIDGTTFSRYGSTGYALETNWFNTSSYTALDNPLTAGAPMGWWLSATTDRVIFMSQAASGELHYVGFFEPTDDHSSAAGAALFPLIVAHFSTAADTPTTSAFTSGARASLTRIPALTTCNWQSHVSVEVPYSTMGGTIAGTDFQGTGETYLARRPVIMGGGGPLGSAAAASNGVGLVGYLIDVANTWTNGSVARGDDLTDTNGDEWIATDDFQNVGLWFKAV